MPDHIDELFDNEYANPTRINTHSPDYKRSKESATALARIARRVRRLETFDRYAVATGGGTFEWGDIVVMHVSGIAAEFFPPTASGMQAAIDATENGDVIWTPPCSITGDFTIPDLVGVTSMGHQSVFRGAFTLGRYSHLEGIEIAISSESIDDLTGVFGPATTEAYLLDTSIQVHNTGSGNAYCVCVSAGGNLEISDCDFTGTADTGEGYAGRYLSGYLYVYNSRVVGSTSPFSPT